MQDKGMGLTHSSVETAYWAIALIIYVHKIQYKDTGKIQQDYKGTAYFKRNFVVMID